MNSQEQPSWIRSLIKSNSNNEQLEFWRFVNIAYICSKTGMPESEMIKFKNIVTDNNRSYLVFIQDNRTKLYQDLDKNPKAELCWFFPLTREKYRIKSKILRISKKDFANNKPESKFFLEELTKVWDALDKEEKKGFAELKPGTQTEEKPTKVHDDINNFNNPDKNEISENFSLIFVDAFEVEHTKFAMPQVVADSRSKFESLFAPYKVTTKYLHTVKENGEWEVVPLNP